MVRLKAIKYIKKLLYFLSFYINLLFFDFYSLKLFLIGMIMIGVFDLIAYLSWWIIYRISLVVFGLVIDLIIELAIKTCY